MPDRFENFEKCIIQNNSKNSTKSESQLQFYPSQNSHIPPKNRHVHASSTACSHPCHTRTIPSRTHVVVVLLLSRTTTGSTSPSVTAACCCCQNRSQCCVVSGCFPPPPNSGHDELVILGHVGSKDTWRRGFGGAGKAMQMLVFSSNVQYFFCLFARVVQVFLPPTLGANQNCSSSRGKTPTCGTAGVCVFFPPR